jgi:hypothetical protein
MRRQRDGLRVVARGECHDAAAPLRVAELQQTIQCAADFEAAGMLQTFGLQQHAHAGESVQRFGLEHGCLDEPAAHTSGGGDDIGNGRQVGVHE